MARHIAILEVIASSIRERGIDDALRPCVSAPHVVRVLVDHRMLLADVDRPDAAHAECAFMLAGHIVWRVERRAVAQRVARYVHQKRHRVRTIQLPRGAQAHRRPRARRDQGRRRVDVVVHAIHLAHAREAVRVVPVQPVGDEHVVHLADLRLGECLERQALVGHIRLRPVIECDEDIDRRLLTRCDDLCVERAVFFLYSPPKAAGERGHAVRFDARDAGESAGRRKNRIGSAFGQRARAFQDKVHAVKFDGGSDGERRGGRRRQHKRRTAVKRQRRDLQRTTAFHFQRCTVRDDPAETINCRARRKADLKRTSLNVGHAGMFQLSVGYKRSAAALDDAPTGGVASVVRLRAEIERERLPSGYIHF